MIPLQEKEKAPTLLPLFPPLSGELRSDTPARRWMALTIFSLLLAGLLSLVLVVGRVPGLSSLIGDPIFAKKCLVIHVNLALSAWFFGFFACLYWLIPGKKSSSFSYYLGGAGIGGMILSGLIPSADPILSNYVPVLNHPVFMASFFAFLAGVAWALFEKGLFSLPSKKNQKKSFLPLASQIALKGAAVIFLLSLLTLVAAMALTPSRLHPRSYYELVFWGGGHLFQFVNLLGMTAVWIVLIQKLTGQTPLGRRGALVLYGSYLLPLLFSPFLLVKGTGSGLYYGGYTELMRWLTWPGVTILIVLAGITLHRARKKQKLGRDKIFGPEFSGLVSSMVLIVVGFVLGALISQSTTLIPAHYHASIGAVTVAYMAVTYLLLAHFGYPLASSMKKWAFYQPLLFGAGQVIFALGFGFAGLHGLGRKVYGHEQHIRVWQEWLGLGVMGLGGILAIVGGILYLVLVGNCLRGKKKS